MASTDTKQQLKDLLRELFQLNNPDLDFGIYRIFNLKAKEVEKFIENDIDSTIENVKNKIIDRQSGDIKAELEEAKSKLEIDFKVDFQKEGDLEAKVGLFGQLELFMEPFNRFKTAKEKLDNLRVSEDTEKSIYNELYRFFERYYESGDFISKPRAGKNNYMIPYGGEEVKLYWANYDQYYIKTGVNFKNYIFSNTPSVKQLFTQVEFRILDAETTVNNNKEEKGRLFVPTEDPFEWIEEERKLLVKFYYRVPSSEDKVIWGDKQTVKKDGKGINQRLSAAAAEVNRSINDKGLALLMKRTKENSKKEAIPLFIYHLERYTTVNKSDYFIHKDLKGFLSRELDFFLKNDVLSIAFLDPTWKEQEVQEAIKNNVLKASVIREISLVVIDFMSELEEFQKRLFEKKKFVVESHYCMTLDRIPVPVYDEVVQHTLTDPDKKQINEWQWLKFISGSELYPSKPKSKKDDEFASAKEFLKTHDKLVIDTKHLPYNLKWKLLAAFDNIDENTEGLLINSENWQALNLLTAKYKGKIKCTYIDPPYNTGNDGFVYKDAFKNSSWLTMLETRLALNKRLMCKDGVVFTSIDDNEHANCVAVEEKVFGNENFISNIIWQKKFSPQNDAKWLSDNHDFILCFAKKKEEWRPTLLPRTDEQNERYQNPDNDPRGLWSSSGLDVRTYSAVYDYPIITPSGRKVNPPKGRCWRCSKERFEELANDNRIWWGVGGNNVPRIKRFLTDVKDGITPLTIWTHSEVGHNQEATQELKHKGLVDFTSPKTVRLLKRIIHIGTANHSIVLDYFAGSGTTAEATIRLSEEDGLSRKYILVEFGKHFSSITKPRIQKTLFSKEWKDGFPLSNESGVSQLFQYIKLEQYEDSLNNIEIHTTAPQLSFLDNIRYQLIYGTKGSDSLINIDKFTAPFDYTMKIVQQNEPREGTNIDLVTTFNFLLGIEVLRYALAENNGLDYKIVIGKKGLQQYIIIWRNFDENTIDLKKEKEFITKQAWYNTTAFVFCNGDNAFSAHPIEPEFIRLMNEPVL
jgi:adenine-specific DNA-methyltransferase